MQNASAFAEFSWSRRKIWPETIRVADLEAWQMTLTGSLSTVVRRMRGLRAFFAYRRLRADTSRCTMAD
ncbi:MAG: hypothetical protein WCR06_06715 [bacterium]